ncbi:ABATE domain-containing protein [Streptomyces sp. NPDC050743]|uniref:ABATE domain-containing protein n=1 Tax=Streptomyces sp. NPDC050743 TaxID=3365634 RepID=UPI0037AAAC14
MRRRGQAVAYLLPTLRRPGTANAVEELPDAEAQATWVRQCDTCPAQIRDATAGLARTAQEPREAIHRTISAARAGRTPDAPPRARASQAVAHAVPVPTLALRGRPVRHAEGLRPSGLRGALPGHLPAWVVSTYPETSVRPYTANP